MTEAEIYPAMEFQDLLAERRKDCDILWASRTMNPLLPHKLSPEGKYTRKQIMEAVVNDPRVKLAILSLSTAKGINQSVLQKEVHAMVVEMASKARLATVRWIGFLITKVLKRIFACIYINERALFNLKKEMQISQVQYVYAPSHRSYLDFILLSYILFSYDMALPNIASGMDFYHMRIVGELLRKTGAFYMRRSFADDLLYKNVFRAYVSSIVSHSDRAIEFFIEGTRSRSLKSIVPKYGLVSIILETLYEGNVPDIYFIPISISYDRPLEELLFAYELLGVPKPKESTLGLLKSLSVLATPSAYSNVYLNVGDHISAQQFLTKAHRKAKVLSPTSKLPTTAVEDLAYCIIDSHKQNTVLTPFNIISMLFNQHIQMYPNDPYNLSHLAEEYSWCKNVLKHHCNAVISTNLSIQNSDGVYSEILDALKPHSDLVTLDASNAVTLRQRHVELPDQKNIRVKGHSLSPLTMSVAVSAINLTIYVNPVLSLLVKPALAVVAIGTDQIHYDAAMERYGILRNLLTTEFAMRPVTDESTLKREWEETINSLIQENCISHQDIAYGPGKNTKLFSLLYNLMLPFIDAVYIACLVLLEWNDLTLGDLTNQKYLAESQKRAEEAFSSGYSWGQHPYTLCLDLYNSTWSNFRMRDIIVPYTPKNVYTVDKIRVDSFITHLNRLSLKRPRGSYNTLKLSTSPPHTTTVQAKL